MEYASSSGTDCSGKNSYYLQSSCNKLLLFILPLLTFIKL